MNLIFNFKSCVFIFIYILFIMGNSKELSKNHNTRLTQFNSKENNNNLLKNKLYKISTIYYY